MAQLSQVYNHNGLYKEALSLAEEALAIQRQKLIPNHPDVATTLSYLGGHRSALSDYEAAPLSKRELIVWNLRKWGLDRVFFGSGYPTGFTPDRALDTITEYPFTQDEIDQILSNTEAQLTGAQ